jgi:hypothetical protein
LTNPEIHAIIRVQIKEVITMAMSYKEFMEYAMQNYCRGGDCIVECWDELSFRYYCEEFGPMTKEKADSLFRLYRNCEG